MTTQTNHIYTQRIDAQPGRTTKIYQERITSDSSPPERARHTGYQVLYYLLDILEVLLAVRLIFKALAANAATPFVNFIYSLTAPLIAPFRGIFPITSAGGVIVEWSTVVAIIVYALAVYAIVRLIDIMAGA